mmetsp:Transcript_1522/g.2030  ORF Transcript_1522/g.2030 Transcript_1522/m.2030 type:complete len:931 (+) Transcript_1522:518-3310(+)
MAPELAWQTRSAALKALTLLCSVFPSELTGELADVIPAITPLLFDTKKDVAAAAFESLRECSDLTGNKDIEHILPKLCSASIRPAEVPETIHALAGTTFVQSVDSATLAVVVPLLSRALALKGASSTAVKRQTALIICNMSKLVDRPIEAAPFLPKLLPGLEKLADELADPEARLVCEKSVALMKALEEKCTKGAVDWKKLSEDIHTTALFPFFNEDTIPNIVADYAAELSIGLAKRNCFDEELWTAALEPVLTQYQDDASGRILCALELAKKATAISIDDNEEENYEEEEARETLCDTIFTLAYGSKILLHNTNLKLKRGFKYGLLGVNDSGKTSLLRSLANNSLDGFPSPDEMRTVFVEADIMGELSHLSCLEYIFRDPRIQACGVERDAVAGMMLKVGFSEKMLGDAVTTLSGGWRMKLALSRAMLQRADVLLLDEPTNHLDVMNVKWVKDYLKSLTNVTAIMVSHDSGLLTDVCDHIIEIDNLKLHTYRGNLTTFVKMKPQAKAYFELKSDKLKFYFPKPSPIEGVKSKGKALIKVENVSLKYPKNDVNTIEKATVQVSLSSRVACIGPNGAGKSTLIKVLTGELTPTTGTVWAHPSARIGYIAQHAFHHIEQHLQMTPNEYVRWRYAGGDDKEAVAKDTMKLTDEEIKAQQTTIDWTHTNPETGEIKKSKRVIARLTGERKTNKSTKENDYEVQFKHPYDGEEHKAYVGLKKLTKYGFAKAAKKVDVRVAQRSSGMFRPLTSSNVEQHFKNVGLEPEFATHSRIQALSGGQKVKVVLGAATWQQPHLMILDEPTNYLDRESLGALAGAIREFDGGIVVISHNSDFTKALCNETWVVEKDEDGISRPDIHGDAEWMAQALATKCDDQAAITEITDQFGNVTEIKQKKTLSKKEIKVMKKKVTEKIKSGAELEEDEEEFAEEHNLWV